MPAITIIIYWIINFLKIVTNENEKFMKFIPVISCGLGIIIGVIVYFTIPNIVVAENVLYAIIVGGASGLAATGTNQIFKQLIKSNNNMNSDKKSDDKEEPK